MQYIIENEPLEILHTPGNGAWTYQLIIPNSKDIKGKWGDIKVNGTIDDYEIRNKNLAPLKNADKKLALNSEIRNSIGKGAGEMVTVTLYLTNQNVAPQNNHSILLDCFKDAGVLDTFNQLQVATQNEMITAVNSCTSEEQKVALILNDIAWLERQT